MALEPFFRGDKNYIESFFRRGEKSFGLITSEFGKNRAGYYDEMREFGQVSRVFFAT